ncbi:exodeoxyribonuclease VII large subunit [Microcella alkaliphila]|jgi:exodeoxyribonuclease VII large subunit|uniref:Exodeoxyribonuclease 7 large subunit n=1 Tax=Microcella alkaliphila TaxID=279828 RepID=A0A0U5BNE8_9MICO|nr:exodeoxyribonuclease VII large subunit [Microcella alkaliphila]BAU31734.1 exodeoxyribonuclease VII, large subunit [Microcella alkaliphila]
MTDAAPVTPAPTSADAPWPVAELSQKLKGWIDRLGAVWVEGEITQWGVSGGNVYGKLKDLSADATVSFVIWSSVRSRIPEGVSQGDRVVMHVKANWWVKGGSLTMQVFDVRRVGLGDLLERLERLRQSLRAEGLFDAARKNPLPFLPSLIGLVTGKDSDAEKDVLRNAALRWPSVAFRVQHSAVQGDRAVGELVAAIEALDADPDVDVIIVARGGGDFQNLLPFSDERVVRAVAACSTPVVSAIGHENDRPLLDDVADLRASTPTDAAKRVVPDVGDELSRVDQARTRLRSRITLQVRTEVERLAQLRSRPVLAGAEWIIDARADELTRLVARGAELTERRIERAGDELAERRARLRSLSPQSTLDRGYAIVQTADGAVLRAASDVVDGARLRVTLADGAIAADARIPGPDTEGDE